MPTTKSTLFLVSKDEWVTKEGTGKSMKKALYVCTPVWHKVRTSWVEVTPNNEKIKPIALTIAELRESEGIREAVS